MWDRIVDKVNALSSLKRSQDGIHKHWNDLRGRAHSLASREHREALATSAGSPGPLNLMPMEEKVLSITPH